jgi:hypothetical protein
LLAYESGTDRKHTELKAQTTESLLLLLHTRPRQRLAFAMRPFPLATDSAGARAHTRRGRERLRATDREGARLATERRGRAGGGGRRGAGREGEDLGAGGVLDVVEELALVGLRQC